MVPSWSEATAVSTAEPGTTNVVVLDDREIFGAMLPGGPPPPAVAVTWTVFDAPLAPPLSIATAA
jgi:hypothetical protein